METLLERVLAWKCTIHSIYIENVLEKSTCMAPIQKLYLHGNCTRKSPQIENVLDILLSQNLHQKPDFSRKHIV